MIFFQNIIPNISVYANKIICNAQSFFNFPDWISDALIDSFKLLPLLFVVFFVIEIIEFFFADKISSSLKKMEKFSIFLGSFAAIVPQCGFSVIASTLYIKKYITKGCLLAIFLATSDEAIPVLLSDTSALRYVFPIIALKLVIAIIFGNLVDLILRDKKYIFSKIECSHEKCEEEIGCCSHSVSKRRKRELIYHPLKHTFNIFVFILLITIALNYLFNKIDLSGVIGSFGVFQIIGASIAGLIPNCAVSVALALMLIKGTISFGAAMAGLLSNAGLGILVLLRHKENIKDTLFLVSVLLLISIMSGIVLNCFCNI